MKGWKFYYKRLGHLLENSFRKYRAYLKPKCYTRYRSIHTRNGFETSPVSVIELVGTEMLTDLGRYFHALVRGLVDSGHDIYVVKSLWLVSELSKKKYAALLIDAEQIHFIDRKQLIENADSIDFLWVDRESYGKRTNSLGSLARKIIHLKISSRPLANRLWMPYQVHPELQNVPKLNKERLERVRSLGVFFIGNLHPGYDSDFVKSHHVMTRVRILETLVERAPNIIRYEKFDTFEGVSQEARNSVFLPNYNLRTKKSNGSIPPDKYLAILSEIDFVICSPGTYMPFAHNVIEAISQGCIPIIQYGHYFSPKLEDGINCLEFNDEESLNLAVTKAVEMSFSERLRMRGEVLRYYNEHLNFTLFLDRVDKLESPVSAFYYG